MSKQTHELTIGQQINVGTATITVQRIGNRKQGDGQRTPVVVVEVEDSGQGE